MTNNSYDFSYSYYKKILSTLNKNYSSHLFSEVPNILEKQNTQPIVFLRHDVDLDLDRALNIAVIEHEHGIKSTFMIMTNCPFYSLQSDHSQTVINKISRMGHEIGLHYNFKNSTNISESSILAESINEINLECGNFENLIDQKIRSVSFHRPLQQFLHGPLFIGDRINAYSSELMQWYLSDSKGSWREGEPIKLLENPKKSLLQLLMHPIWWGDQHLSAGERLQSFFEERTNNLSEEARIEFDKKLSSHLSIFRSKKQGV